MSKVNFCIIQDLFSDGIKKRWGGRGLMVVVVGLRRGGVIHGSSVKADELRKPVTSERVSRRASKRAGAQVDVLAEPASRQAAVNARRGEEAAPVQREYMRTKPPASVSLRAACPLLTKQAEQLPGRARLT